MSRSKVPKVRPLQWLWRTVCALQMAAMVGLSRRIEEIAIESYDRKNEAERQKVKEYTSAVTVQSWIRACRVRRYMKYIAKRATTMQKYWRAFRGRALFRALVKEKVLMMKMAFYNKMATKVQKIWRGYFTRKYVFSYYSRKRYLEALQIKNEIIRLELRQYSELQSAERKRRAEKEEAAGRAMEDYREHHLLSTYQISGIYHNTQTAEGEDKESRLRAVPLGSHRSRPMTLTNPAWLDYNKHAPTHLPPLPPSKPQGPFLQPKATQGQRFRPFQPSLRMATDFYALEKARAALKADEWVHRLHDDIFQPFSRCRHQYQPLLHRQSSYGMQAYGSRHFREEQPKKHVSKKSFKSQVRPISTFDHRQV